MAEKSAWDRYRETINNLEKEWEDISIQFTKDRAALLSAYGDKIPDDVETKLAKKEVAVFQSIDKKIREESGRFADQLQAQGISPNTPLANKEPTKETPLERTPDGVPKSPLYSKFIGDYQPAPSKEPSPPAKSKDQERER
jgi:hypothetical protein